MHHAYHAHRTHRTHRTLVAAALLGASAILAITTISQGAREGDADGGAELARIRAHFDSVERELLGRDVSALTAEQRARRMRQIRTLQAYRERGVFPRNRDFPGRLVPYFVDEEGRLCAVAHLLAASGRRDIVDRVAAGRNNAYVPELADAAALVAWLDTYGLTVAEAARIQPAYGWNPSPEPQANRRATVDRDYALASVLTSGLAGGAIAWNLGTPPPGGHRWREAIGLAAGALGVALGASQLDARGAPLAVGIANAAIGAGHHALGALLTPWDRRPGAWQHGPCAASPGFNSGMTTPPPLPQAPLG